MRVEVIVLVRVLDGIIFTLVVPPLEVAQGPLLALLLGYSPSEVVSLVWGATLLNISASFLRAAVCLSSNAVSRIVGVGLRIVWVISAAACVATLFDEIIGNISVARENYVVSETISLDVLGMQGVRQR